ncbi:MAG: HU family DNA-binding protein [Rhodospirillaceae bacterium]
MTLNELRTQLAGRTKLPKGVCSDVVDVLLATMISGLSEGKKVQVRDFGTFETTIRAGWTGRDPRSGEEVEIKPAKTVKFRASQALRRALD